MTSGNAVLVAGSANLDFVVRAARIPAPGETILGHDFATFPGGKGANQAVACARAGGATTRMLLALGDDSFAIPLERSLRSAGVELEIVRTHEVSTGVAFICLTDDAENAITVAPGANSALRAGHLPDLSRTSHLLLQLETPMDTVVAWARAAHAASVQVVLNAAPARELPLGLLATIDMLIVNEGELAMLSGLRGDVAAGLAKIDVPRVFVTLGARGCCARVDGEILLQPAFAVEAVDTTGAGDTFCGTLVASFAQGAEPVDALRRACAASALACTRLGAQSSVPMTNQVDVLLATGRESTSRDDLASYCGFAG
jgi:ribokinase